ncbi:MAG: ABC transporter permease [Chloroflexi bacterium]|nr:ABC transporter permease [Chloroflexota bacterium]
MGKYLVRRLFQAVPLLIGVSLIGFTILHTAPGGPLAMYALNPAITAADIQRIKQQLGLDQPIHIQYFTWASAMARGDWGSSYRDGRPVRDIILDRVPATLQLVITAMVIAISLGLLVGILGAVKRYSVFDYLATAGAMMALSLPTFWFGLMVIYLFAVELSWLPPGGIATLGQEPTLGDRLHHLIGPAAVLGLVIVATWSRYTRSSMLEVINQDYIRTARAKGLLEKTILFRHALRNAMIPLVTLAGLELRFLFSGALVTESVFSWPGMGRLFVDSLAYSDYPVLLSMLMVSASFVIAGNLLADVLYGLVDPRIRLR